MDNRWLIDNGTTLGNALMSGVGLAFAIGAPVRTVNAHADTGEAPAGRKFETLKFWWIIFWASLLIMYPPWDAFVSPSKAIHPWAIFHGVSTAAVTMLWLHSSQEKQRKTKLVIIFCLVFFLTMASSYLDFWFDEKNLIITLIAYLFAWLAFLLLAWNYRRQIKTALVLLAYAYLQLPIKTTGVGNFQLDFAVLITSKTLLIGAMYSTLGVEDKKT